MKRHLHTIIFAIIIGLTMLHDAHLIAFQPNMDLAIAATIYLAVDATLKQVKNKKMALIILASILAPVLMYGIYQVGYELGKTLANVL